MLDLIKNVIVSEELLAQMFGNMMDDRDKFSPKEWLDRYSQFIMAVVDAMFVIKGEEIDKKKKIHFCSKIASELYSKEYDKQVKEFTNPTAKA